MSQYKRLYEEERAHAGYWEMIAHILARRFSIDPGTGRSSADLIADAKAELPDLNDTLEKIRAAQDLQADHFIHNIRNQ